MKKKSKINKVRTEVRITQSFQHKGAFRQHEESERKTDKKRGEHVPERKDSSFGKKRGYGDKQVREVK